MYAHGLSGETLELCFTTSKLGRTVEVSIITFCCHFSEQKVAYTYVASPLYLLTPLQVLCAKFRFLFSVLLAAPVIPPHPEEAHSPRNHSKEIKFCANQTRASYLGFQIIGYLCPQKIIIFLFGLIENAHFIQLICPFFMVFLNFF